jgi:hypothetical protein
MNVIMKKITQVCVLAFVSLMATRASAQITLSSADLPHAGLTLVTATDSTSAFMAGPAGASQSWNFGTAKKQLTSEIMFMLPSATKYSSVPAFTKANLCDSTAGKTNTGAAINGYNFFNINSNVFEVEGSEQIVPYKTSGITVTFQVELSLDSEFVQAQLPGVYGEEFHGRCRGQQDQAKSLIIYDSVRIITNITYFDTVDAWGTMTLPTGTFNVLRKSHHEVDVDSVSEHSSGGSWGAPSATTTTSHVYQWFTNGAGYILAEMNVNPSTGAFMNLVWDTTAAPTGINEVSFNSHISTFPNPCTSQINFILTDNNTQAKNVTVYDVTGRELAKIEMKNNNTILNTTTYSSGMYLYNITDNNGNVIDHGKFMVK